MSYIEDELERMRAALPAGAILSPDAVGRLLAHIDALQAERDEARKEARNKVTLSEVAKAGAHLRAEVARLREALKAFLHLTKRSADDEIGADALTNLPDSHPFELTWGSDGSGYPQITVGQIKRARAALRDPG